MLRWERGDIAAIPSTNGINFLFRYGFSEGWRDFPVGSYFYRWRGERFVMGKSVLIQVVLGNHPR